MNKKETVVDASSIIILFKTGLFPRLLEEYHIIITHSVYHELTIAPHTGAKEIRAICNGGKIEILPVTAAQALSFSEENEHASMDRGELDTIYLFKKGVGDFIIIDDGKGARFCRDNHLPYINALLFPRILFFEGKCSQSQCRQLIDKIIEIGRYSEDIINFALNCQRDYLKFFIT